MFCPKNPKSNSSQPASLFFSIATRFFLCSSPALIQFNHILHIRHMITRFYYLLLHVVSKTVSLYLSLSYTNSLTHSLTLSFYHLILVVVNAEQSVKIYCVNTKFCLYKSIPIAINNVHIQT